MNVIRKLSRYLWVLPAAEPDPELARALDEVDAAKLRFDLAIDSAQRRGVFDSLRANVVQTSLDDAARIRRRRRRG